MNKTVFGFSQRKLQKTMLDHFPFLFSHQQGVAKRLLFFIIIFSSLVTLVATAIQLYTDYQRDIKVIERRLDEIETSYLDSIQASLWNMDIQQIELQLEGIVRFPDVKAVELVETGNSIAKPLALSFGEKGGKHSITRTYAIMHADKDETLRQLGTLYIETTLEEIYDRLFERAAVILLSQGIKTFLVSMFILYLFYRLVTRHLEKISEHVSNINLTKPIPVLSLNRKPNKNTDELDDVVNAFNAMYATLISAYGDLQDTNLALEEDIVARQRAEEEIKRLNAELEQRVFQRTSELEAANNELSSFCYSVSHDLRAPLRRIEGFRSILVDRYGKNFDSKGAHYLKRIEAGTHEMSEMIDSFLKLSRSTNTTLTLERINLSGIADKINQRLLEKDPERTVDIRLQRDLYIEGDRRLLDIMLANLIENAWKYTQRTDKPIIEFGLKDNVYFVKDNGAGFDMKLSEHLFTPFTRLHTNNEFEGIGIGLATVQRIIARHGGRVWFDASINHGTTFYFTLWEKNQKDVISLK